MTRDTDFFEKFFTVYLDVFDDNEITIYEVTTIADLETVQGLKNAGKIVDLIETQVQ